MSYCVRLFTTAIVAVLILACGGRLAVNEVRPQRELYSAESAMAIHLGDSSATLVVVVRAVEHPESPLVASRVQLAPPGPPPEGIMRDALQPDRDGMVRFTGVVPGDFWLRAASIGYRPALIRLQLKPGCLTRVEVSLAVDWICETPETPCPRASPRARVLTCGKP